MHHRELYGDQIVFVNYADNNQLWMVNADGSTLMPLLPGLQRHISMSQFPSPTKTAPAVSYSQSGTANFAVSLHWPERDNSSWRRNRQHDVRRRGAARLRAGSATKQ